MLAPNPNKFKSYSKYILQLYTDQNDSEEENNSEYISCYISFSSKQKLSDRYRLNKDRNIIYTIDNLTHKPCPNANRNTWRDNDHELKKHILHHCHLAINEREYYKINNTSGCINRKNPSECGLPNNALLIGNHTAQYDGIQKHGPS